MIFFHRNTLLSTRKSIFFMTSPARANNIVNWEVAILSLDYGERSLQIHPHLERVLSVLIKDLVVPLMCPQLFKGNYTIAGRMNVQTKQPVIATSAIFKCAYDVY